MAIGKSAEHRVERANLAIMKHPSFCAWAGLLFIGSWEVKDDVPTAYVNMRGDVKYGRKFIEDMPKVGNTDPHVNFVVLHETGHKALLHLTRGKEMFERNPIAANIAADHVVNNLIKESDPSGTFAKMPVDADGKEIGACDPKYKGWSMKEVFNDIMKDAKQITVKVGSGEGGMDQHDITVEGGGELTKDEKEAIEQAVEQALRNGAYLAGKQGGDANRLVGEMLEPEIDWRALMADFVQEVTTGDDEATWRRPLRRFVGEDVYLPSTYQETIGALGCSIDTSGSVGEKEMTACLSEVVSLCRMVRPARLELVYWDSGIRRTETYTPDQYDDIVRLTKPKGGGGTMIRETNEYFNKMKDLQAVINLTDGYIGDGWGKWNVPVLWVLTTRNMVADNGKSLYINVD